MKKSKVLIPLFALTLLVSCAQENASSNVVSIAYSSYSGESKGEISVCASELPHAKILNDCVARLVAEDGYSLKVTVLDWTIQNDAVAHGEYDANYFEHVPYLKQYSGSTPL
ncbi:MAG: MetQ/NlpA family ABC transporter substrate-binding protein, partial [Bacilli bacterium]